MIDKSVPELMAAMATAARVAELERELERLKSECLRYENEIAEVCDEDCSLKETFAAMNRTIERLKADIASTERRSMLRAAEIARKAIMDWILAKAKELAS